MTTLFRSKFTRYQQIFQSSTAHINHKSLFSTLQKDLAQKRALVEQQSGVKPVHNPQAAYADVWTITTADRIEQLTQELHKASSSKKMAIFGTLAAMTCGKMGWYQFQFMGMPFEMELVMVHLPTLCLAGHWMSWYFNMNDLYKKMTFKLPKNWKNEGLIGGSNPDYAKLIDFSVKDNLVLLDQWGNQLNKHRIICASMFALNMSAIMLTATINPLGDPLLAAMEPMTVMAYSFYPLVPYAFTAILYGSPMKNIPLWKREIVENLELQNAQSEN